MRLWQIAGAVLLVVLAWGLWERQGKVSAQAETASVRRDLASAKAALAQAEEAARVHRVYLRKLDEFEAAATATRNDLETMEGGDAPLSPYLAAAARRLWAERAH